MNGIARILNQMTVLIARLGKEGLMGIDVVHVVRKGDGFVVEECLEGMAVGWIEGKKLKYPVALVVVGYGIVRKVCVREEMEGMERVMESDEFLKEAEERENGEVVFAFTRRDRVAELFERLEEERVPVVEVHVEDVAVGGMGVFGEEGDAREIAMLFVKRFYRKGITWKELMRGGERGDRLAGVLAGKMKLPLLVCLLFLLLINYLWNDSVREKYTRQQTELTLLERTVSSREKLSREMERVVAEFKGNRTFLFCPLLDRVAAVVPGEVNLETMTVNPLLKSVEEKRPLVVREGYVELTGFTTDPDQVTRLTGSLSECAFARQVRLISLDKNRETGVFNFKVLIGL